MNLTYWTPFAIVIIGNVLYHNIAKITPITVPPFLALSVTYLVSFTICALVYIFTGQSFRQDIQTLNWASIAWGVALVAIEFGYILLYRVGWKVSTASLMVNITGAILLAIIGVLFYKEILSLKQIVGIGLCMLGIFFLRS